MLAQSKSNTPTTNNRSSNTANVSQIYGGYLDVDNTGGPDESNGGPGKSQQYVLSFLE